MRVEFTDMGLVYNELLFGKIKEFEVLGKINDLPFTVYLDIILLGLHPDSPMYNAYRRSKNWETVFENSSHRSKAVVKEFYRNRYFLEAVAIFNEIIKHDDKNNYVVLIDKEISTIEEYLETERTQREKDLETIRLIKSGELSDDEKKYIDVTPKDEEVQYDFGGVEALEVPEITPMITYIRSRSECLEIIIKLMRMRDDFEERAVLRKTKKGQEQEEEVAKVRF